MANNSNLTVPDEAVQAALTDLFKNIQKFAVDSIDTVIPTIQQAMADRGKTDNGDRKWGDGISEAIRKIKEYNKLIKNSTNIPLTADDKFQRKAEVFNSMAKAVGGVGSAMKDAGSLMEAFGASGESTAIVNGVGGALEGLASIDFKNPVSWVTGTMKALTAIFSIGDNVKEAKIQRLQQQVTALANDYKQLQHDIENCYSDEVNKKYDEELENLQKQKAKAEEMARLEASKKKSDKSKVEQYHEQAAQLQRDIENTQKAQIEMLAGTSIKDAKIGRAHV